MDAVWTLTGRVLDNLVSMHDGGDVVMGMMEMPDESLYAVPPSVGLE